jgi:hypothetical protein
LRGGRPRGLRLRGGRLRGLRLRRRRPRGLRLRRLRDLFFAIDAGDERLDLPPYNGRLFSDGEHPFLANYAVGDAHLVPALDKQAPAPMPQRISYHHWGNQVLPYGVGVGMMSVPCSLAMASAIRRRSAAQEGESVSAGSASN